LKTARKVFLYLLTVVTAALVAVTAGVYFFKDQLVRQFIELANERLNTPITIGKIDVSAWQDFPNLSIVFHDIYVEDSHPAKDTLLWAKRISFSLNPIEVWKEKYEIRGLQVEKSKTFLKINVAGRSNYRIIKDAGSGTGNISFNLKNVNLADTWVSYQDRSTGQSHLFSSNHLSASISITGSIYDIDGQGDVRTNQIGISDRIFLAGKEFNVLTTIHYDDERKSVLIDKSELQLGSSSFVVEGSYLFADKNQLDLSAQGTNTNIQTILSLMPADVAERLAAYRSEGNVFFKLTLKGELSEKKNPLLAIEFGATNASIFHPDYQSSITHANMNGSFATPSFSDLSQAELFLKQITGELNGQPFEADFSMQNFDDPLVALDFKGKLDAHSVLQFYPIPTVHELTGMLTADVSLDGKIALLKNKSTAQQVHTSGTVEMEDVTLVAGEQKVSLKDLNGSFQFNNNDLALSDVHGKLGKSDFQLNGHFRNAVTYLLFDNQPIGIEADLVANYIDLDQIFHIGFGDRSSDDYEFTISPNLHLNFNCDIHSLHYKRFHPLNVKGNLLIKNQMAVSRNLEVNALGGALSLNGIIDAKNPKAIDVVSSFKLDGVHVDSIFYLFENFDQDFIQDKHLKGQALADVSLEMTLNDKLVLFPETLVADVSAVIKNGELNNFEPLQALNKYLDDEGLNKLRFADLKNDIHIENKTVYIPQMEIKSNVTTIQLSGTHTFDQRIDYRVIAPLRNKKKIDPDEAFGAIEEDSRGQTKIFLKITGTTDNYKVSLDKEAVKKKIASDIKQEVKELKDAFKLKGKKKQKELELSEEEFDWDDNPNN
jgi:hypothetical protein